MWIPNREEIAHHYRRNVTARVVAMVRIVRRPSLNQPIEWADRAAMLGATDGFGEIGKLVSSAGWEPTFVFRLGIAEQPAGRSPRRPLEEVLRT